MKNTAPAIFTTAAAALAYADRIKGRRAGKWSTAPVAGGFCLVYTAPRFSK